MPPNVPPNTPPSDEAKTSPRARSSVTYPSKNGSDVDRSAGFWSWLTLASSVTGFKQSMVANVSEPDYESLKVVQEYLSKYCHYRILDEFSEWFPEVCCARTRGKGPIPTPFPPRKSAQVLYLLIFDPESAHILFIPSSSPPWLLGAS